MSRPSGAGWRRIWPRRKRSWPPRPPSSATRLSWPRRPRTSSTRSAVVSSWPAKRSSASPHAWQRCDERLREEPRIQVNNPIPSPDEIAALLQVEHLLDQRWPETKLDPSTARISALLELLGSPQRAYPSIHVAGTNGKTSVARIIDALLIALHRRTGRTTSPHLQSAVERISIDGKPVTPAQYVNTYTEIEPFVELVDRQSEAAGGPKMSKFE